MHTVSSLILRLTGHRLNLTSCSSPQCIIAEKIVEQFRSESRALQSCIAEVRTQHAQASAALQRQVRGHLGRDDESRTPRIIRNTGEEWVGGISIKQLGNRTLPN